MVACVNSGAHSRWKARKNAKNTQTHVYFLQIFLSRRELFQNRTNIRISYECGLCDTDEELIRGKSRHSGRLELPTEVKEPGGIARQTSCHGFHLLNPDKPDMEQNRRAGDDAARRHPKA